MDPISFGRLWPETVASVRRHTDLLWPLAAAFLFLPQLLVAWHLSDVPPDKMLRGEVVMGDRIAILLLVLILTFAQLVIARIVGQDGTEGRTLGAELQTAFARLPAALATMLILSVIAVLLSLFPLIIVFALGADPKLGAVVLLVVTFWINVRLALAVPLLATQFRGPTAAIGEAWRLTRGHSLRIAAILGAMLVGFALLGWAIGGLGMAVGAISTGSTSTVEPGWGVGRWLFELLSDAASSAMLTYWFAFQAVLMGALQQQNRAA